MTHLVTSRVIENKHYQRAYSLSNKYYVSVGGIDEYKSVMAVVTNLETDEENKFILLKKTKYYDHYMDMQASNIDGSRLAIFVDEQLFIVDLDTRIVLENFRVKVLDSDFSCLRQPCLKGNMLYTMLTANTICVINIENKTHKVYKEVPQYEHCMSIFFKGETLMGTFYDSESYDITYRNMETEEILYRHISRENDDDVEYNVINIVGMDDIALIKCANDGECDVQMTLIPSNIIFDMRTDLCRKILSVHKGKNGLDIWVSSITSFSSRKIHIKLTPTLEPKRCLA